MSEWTNAAEQVVDPGDSVVFTANPVPCSRGLVWLRDDSGLFQLQGVVSNVPRCRCQGVPSAVYQLDFGANVAVPANATAGPISLAITQGGAELPASVMTVTPADVEQFFNVSRALNVLVRRGCCDSVTIKNISDIPVVVQNANIIFARPDMR